ncbi:hypothetical protein [Shewanella frigidimarina]|uniref:hypothetical protein n=1 Tax=Shewanella frigidimarina TaxID=56812 RepID=UPI003D7B671C
MDTLEINQIIYWILLSGFIVYQAKHSRWEGTPEKVRILITINSSIFSIGFFVYLIMWGDNYSWVGALLLFIAAMFHPLVFLPLAKLLGRYGNIHISFIGLICLPILAWLLYTEYQPLKKEKYDLSSYYSSVYKYSKLLNKDKKLLAFAPSSPILAKNFIAC